MALLKNSEDKTQESERSLRNRLRRRNRSDMDEDEELLSPNVEATDKSANPPLDSEGNEKDGRSSSVQSGSDAEIIQATGNTDDDSVNVRSPADNNDAASDAGMSTSSSNGKASNGKGAKLESIINSMRSTTPSNNGCKKRKLYQPVQQCDKNANNNNNNNIEDKSNNKDISVDDDDDDIAEIDDDIAVTSDTEEDQTQVKKQKTTQQQAEADQLRMMQEQLSRFRGTIENGFNKQISPGSNDENANPNNETRPVPPPPGQQPGAIPPHPMMAAFPGLLSRLEETNRAAAMAAAAAKHVGIDTPAPRGRPPKNGHLGGLLTGATGAPGAPGLPPPPPHMAHFLNGLGRAGGLPANFPVPPGFPQGLGSPLAPGSAPAAPGGFPYMEMAKQIMQFQEQQDKITKETITKEILSGAINNAEIASKITAVAPDLKGLSDILKTEITASLAVIVDTIVGRFLHNRRQQLNQQQQQVIQQQMAAAAAAAAAKQFQAQQQASSFDDSLLKAAAGGSHQPHRSNNLLNHRPHSGRAPQVRDRSAPRIAAQPLSMANSVLGSSNTFVNSTPTTRVLTTPSSSTSLQDLLQRKEHSQSPSVQSDSAASDNLPEQDEALSLVVTPKKQKRAKVTDTRMIARSASRLETDISATRLPFGSPNSGSAGDASISPRGGLFPGNAPRAASTGAPGDNPAVGPFSPFYSHAAMAAAAAGLRNGQPNSTPTSPSSMPRRKDPRRSASPSPGDFNAGETAAEEFERMNSGLPYSLSSKSRNKCR